MIHCVSLDPVVIIHQTLCRWQCPLIDMPVYNESTLFAQPNVTSGPRTSTAKKTTNAKEIKLRPCNIESHHQNQRHFLILQHLLIWKDHSFAHHRNDIATEHSREGLLHTSLGWSCSTLKPVLNWTYVCSPEHTSDTSTNYDSFLNWTFSSPNMVRTVQTLLHSQLACNEMQASARTCGRRAADSMIENVG